MRALIAIVNPQTAAADAAARGLTLDIVEEPTVRADGTTTLVEITGTADAVREQLIAWGVEDDECDDFMEEDDAAMRWRLDHDK